MEITNIYNPAAYQTGSLLRKDKETREFCIFQLQIDNFLLSLKINICRCTVDRKTALRAHRGHAYFRAKLHFLRDHSSDH